jgi:hypothetical protein
MGLDPKEAYKRLESLKSERTTWENHWQELADYVVPTKSDILSFRAAGEKRMQNVYDGTAIQANELLAGALHGMLTNPSAYWFELYTGVDEVDNDDAARKWFQDVAHLMHDIMNNSNFQTEIHEIYIDLGSIGTGCLYIDEDDESIVRFIAQHISNAWVSENKHGMIDTIYRTFKWKPRDIISEYGKDNVPKWILDKADISSEEKIEILHVVEPRATYDNKSIVPKDYKFASCTYVKGASEPVLLKESGFRTMPCVVPRWTKGTGEVYGRSPSMKSLPDIKMVNQMMQSVIRGAQKAVDPPLLVPDDSVIGSIRMTPGGLNYFRGGTQDFIRPLDTGAKVDLGFQVMEDVRKRIRDAFYIDQLQLQEGPQMTATEVMQRTEEKIRVMGPVLGRQHSELLQPLIERLYEICDRRRLLPDMPDIMHMHKPIIRVQYRSMLAKAQLATEANNITRTFQAAAPFVQVDPNVVDIVDAEAGVRYIAKLYGLPTELIRNKDEIKKIRQQKSDQQQAMMQQQQQAQAVQQAPQLASAIKDMHSVVNAPAPKQQQ